MNKFIASNLKKLNGSLFVLKQKNVNLPQVDCLKIFDQYGIKFKTIRLIEDIKDVNIGKSDFVLIYGDERFLKDSSVKLKRQEIIYDDFSNWFCNDLRVYNIALMGYQEYIDICDNKIIISSRVSKNIVVRRLFSNNILCGKKNIVRIGKVTTVTNSCLIVLCGHNAYVHISDRATIRNLEIQVSTDGKVTIDEDVMFARDVVILQTDQHLIFDLYTKERINRSKEVYIGKHVWIGRGVMLLGGATIMDNCVVGAKSVTSSRFNEKNCIIAGNPAKIIRRNIIWSRDSARLDKKNFSECSDKEYVNNIIISDKSKERKICNIIGSCVTRDVFELEDNDSFNVNCYVGRNGIISSCMAPIDTQMLYNPNDKIGWENRMVLCDMSKSMFRLLADKSSEWLIIDLIDERFGLLEVKTSVLTTYITYSQVLQRSPYLNMVIKDKRYTVMDQDDISDFLIKEMFKQFCEKVSHLYPAEKIIIHKAYPVFKYRALDGEIKDFNHGDVILKYRNRLSKYYNLLEENFGNKVYTIEMPDNTIGDESHKWGLASTHFTKDYYEYILQQMKNIIQ